MFSADQKFRMTTDAESNAMTLKEQLEQGEYNVDSKKVADAILRNPFWITLLAGATQCPPKSRPAVG
jgi:Anti-sigma-28 factor, FlgM